MKITSFPIVCLMALLLLMQWACKSDGSGETPDPCTSQLDQGALFQSTADQLIIPRYQAFQTAVNTLQSKTTSFLAAPEETTLLALQEAFKAAYVNWQYVAQYQFGPAEEVGLQMAVNNFPADISLIQANIENGKTDFSQPEAFDRGFPAMDYLLFGLADNNADIIAKYIDDTAIKVNYQAYLQNNIDAIKTKIDQVLNKWEKEGFREDFIAATGTAAGASLSQMINGLNQHYEIIRREKLGIPVGALTLGFANPEKTEAYFAGISTQLALTATQAAQEFYLGKGVDGVNRTGLDDYLQQISETAEGQALHQSIAEQFNLAITALVALADPLSEEINNNQSDVEATYAEVVKQVVNIKTDLPSLLCIAITYVDNPSDSD